MSTRELTPGGAREPTLDGAREHATGGAVSSEHKLSNALVRYLDGCTLIKMI